MHAPFFVTLSPAKKFANSSESNQLLSSTTPAFLFEADDLARKLRTLSASQLSEIMHISSKLADLNHERYQGFVYSARQTEHQALFSFAGDAYQSLSAETLPASDILYCQNILGILSGLYGMLRPLDCIQQYRLEMGCRPFPPSTLYAYWRDKLSAHLSSQLAANSAQYHLNLASKEYADAIDHSTLPVPTITPTFAVAQDANRYRVIGILAKRARGAFLRFILTQRPSELSDLTSFSWDGFSYHSTLSTDTTPLFLKN